MTLTNTSTSIPLLELRGISKHYGGVTALSGVSLEINAGEVVALIGDNGAGKSTLVKIISGVVSNDEGEILIDGTPIKMNTARDAAAAGIQTVYQDLALCNNLDTVQNLFLGRELARPWYLGGRLRHGEMEARARKVLNEMGVTIRDLSVPAEQLSGGQRQSSAICRAILSKARVVMLDEPTAALGVKQRKQVLELVKRLKQSNIGVVLISHDLADVMKLADRVVALRLGRNVAELSGEAITHPAMVSAITGASDPLEVV